MDMKWPFYVFLLVLVGVPASLIITAVWKNSVGLGLLGVLAVIGALGFLLWIAAQFNTDI